MDFAVQADHTVKNKDRQKVDKYLDLTEEVKTLWNIRVTMIPIVVGVLGTITEGLEKRMEEVETSGRIETKQTRALMR